MYNLLTKRLLKQGFSVQSHPDYVQLPGFLNTTLNNDEGGFVYTPKYLNKMVFKTNCGIYLKGFNDAIIRGIYFNGQEYSPENDEILISCPYKKNSCEPNELGENNMCYCSCKKVEKAEYTYEKSLEFFQRKSEIKKTQKFLEFSQHNNGKACMIQSYYNSNTGEWNENFNVHRCVECISNSNCSYCNLLGRTLSEEIGNVMFEMTETWTAKNGTKMNFTEEKLLFKQPISIDICKLALEYQKKPLLQELYQSIDAMLYERKHPDYKISIHNMRVTQSSRKIKKNKKRRLLKEREKLHQL